MSQNPRQTEQTTDKKPSLGQSLKTLLKYAAVINLLVAVGLTAFGAFVLDALAGVADYHGAGRVIMTVLYVVGAFLFSYAFAFAAELMLAVGACVMYIAGKAIFGGGGRRSPSQPNNRA